MCIRFDVSVQEGFIATGLEFVEKPHIHVSESTRRENNSLEAQ